MTRSTLLQFLANGTIAGSHYAMVGIGFSLIAGSARYLPINLIIAYTGAAYATYGAMRFIQCNIVLGVCFGVAVAALCGAIVDSLCFARLRNKTAPSSSFLLCGLGLVAAFQSLIALTFGDQTVTFPGASAVGTFNVGGMLATWPQIAICISMGIVGGCCFIGQWFFRIGKIQVALSCDSELLRMMGAPIALIQSSVSAFGAAIVGLGGILQAFDTDLTPTMGFVPALMGMAASLVGGLNSIGGAIVGGLIVGLVQNCCVLWLPTEWQDAIVFCFLLALLLLRPRGIGGVSHD